MHCISIYLRCNYIYNLASRCIYPNTDYQYSPSIVTNIKNNVASGYNKNQPASQPNI